MAESALKLSFLAPPQSTYRERYISELDPRRNRAQRFIRAGVNPYNFDYPTIGISNQLNNRRLYIRVTLTTISSELIPVVCVHPYPIDTTEFGVIKDIERNTLYFPISEEEFSTGRKSFRITRKKLIQYELRNYGQLRLLNSDEKDIQRINDPNDARRIIDSYQLGKSQLIFSFAELLFENQLPVIYNATSIYSDVMSAITPTASTTTDDELSIKYVPKKGYWQGRDEILMVIPKIDKRRIVKIIFEHPLMNRIDDIQVDFVDTKTITFLTPPCPIPSNGNQKIQIPIVVMQGSDEIARVNFLYQSFDNCLTCHTNFMFDSFDEQPSTTNTYFDDSDTFMFDDDQNIKIENDPSEK